MQVNLMTDRPQIRELISEILSAEESELNSQARTETQPDLVPEGKWSIVFCDVISSGADGSSVLQRLKQICLTPAPGASAQTGEKTPIQGEWSSLAAVAGRYVQEVLRHTQGNKQAAARILDIEQDT